MTTNIDRAADLENIALALLAHARKEQHRG